ncbi:unnamed protein product [Ranitomeya imitator]|uniref:Uncharacterized protein n=1 Tax=Ranitomeya imitator TaxID=111125 RepID=A0ABN9M0Z0_9NEOB|nr:unnamed protein product [Ranitomeya imitator]
MSVDNELPITDVGVLDQEAMICRSIEFQQYWVDQVSATSSRRRTGVEDSDERRRLRIQDKELQEISDQGMCLSMHQPWASLLVAGIKSANIFRSALQFQTQKS